MGEFQDIGIAGNEKINKKIKIKGSVSVIL
jgi:hypothetical protein